MVSETAESSESNPSVGRQPEKRLRRLIWLTAAPGLLAALILLWRTDLPTASKITLWLFLGLLTLLPAATLTTRLRYWLGTLSNLVSSLREGDYSFRARRASREDPMGELVMEINALADQLRRQRLDARETAGLLRNVMEAIPVCVFTFDPTHRLRLVNRTGERTLGKGQNQVLGRHAEELGLAECLRGDPNRTLELTFGGTLGRWALRRTTVRQEGYPFQLVVLTDLSRTLREEERLAWQRIVRVIGHEVNNSLAPIQSIAASLDKLLALPADQRAEDWSADLKNGLSVIRTRAEALSRFMQAYARLARLPPPRRGPVQVTDWIQRTAALEKRIDITIQSAQDVTLHADRDQLDQLLINLVTNAVDAALEGRSVANNSGDDEAPKVVIDWEMDTEGKTITVKITDNGPGIAASDNLFVPFFTTKPGGTGIGLALCRQIAEGHDGSLSLTNRQDHAGAQARLQLPLKATTQTQTPPEP